mmetsp:Transcript_41844/g.99258  ORF Transcript_41844/g.99258 Transcript_41844/m.99258 type:complete len:392 (-) Transcript_41844:120-1295(-)
METVNLVSGRLAIHPRSFFLDRKRIKRPTVCRNTSNNDNTSSDAREKYASLGSWNARFGLAQEKLPKRVLSTTLPADKEKVQPGMTVYSVRITTSTERGSELTSLYGGIWLCMIGKDGSSILHRFSPVVDSTDLQNQLFEICETDSWEEAGANCSVSEVPQTPSSQWNSKSVKHRFREGSVDEESFMAPELGPLSAVIIGPEDGAWRLHEVNISSSRTGHSDRFICRQRMGCKNSERSAAYLTPVPEDAVVYGSGESAVIMSKVLRGGRTSPPSLPRTAVCAWVSLCGRSVSRDCFDVFSASTGRPSKDGACPLRGPPHRSPTQCVSTVPVASLWLFGIPRSVSPAVADLPGGGPRSPLPRPEAQTAPCPCPRDRRRPRRFTRGACRTTQT